MTGKPSCLSPRERASGPTPLYGYETMRSGTGLKNYTTKIKVEQTVMEIEKVLSKHGVSDIWKEYSGDGEINGMNFVVKTEHGKIPFKLPANITAVQQVLKNQKNAGKLSKIPWHAINDMAQSRRVAWRIILDWIDAQMALIELEMVTVEQVFLPYAYDPVKEKTLYESLSEKRFVGMLMDGMEAKQ